MDGAVRLDNVQKTVATGADENFSAHLPAKAKPVALRRKSTPDAGMQEENHEWLPYLTDGIGKGVPGAIQCGSRAEVLTSSGHPPRRTRELVNAFAKGAGGDVLGLEGIRGYGDVRRRCLLCVDGNAAEVRRCTTMNCPFWPYRMGVNQFRQKRTLSEDRRRAAAERFAKMREAR